MFVVRKLDTVTSLIYRIFSGRRKNKQPSPLCIRFYSKCHHKAFTDTLDSVQWQVIEDRWEYWFLKIADAHIPLRKVRVKSSSFPWIGREIRALMWERNYPCTKAKNSKRDEDWVQYHKLKNHVTWKLKQATLRHDVRWTQCSQSGGSWWNQCKAFEESCNRGFVEVWHHYSTFAWRMVGYLTNGSMHLTSAVLRVCIIFDPFQSYL